MTDTPATPDINTPEIEDFILGALTEAQHQRARWGEAHDRSKSAENWYWLVGYLAGKALRASIQGDREKALHHTISAAAALSQWHEAIKHDASGSGVGEDADLQPAETAPTDQHSIAAPDLTLAAYRREIAELQEDTKRLRERLSAPVSRDARSVDARAWQFVAKVEDQIPLTAADAAALADLFAAALIAERAEGRRAAIEKAVMVCKERSRSATLSLSINPYPDDILRNTAETYELAASAIRALADSPLPETGLMAPSPEPAPGSQ